jgi:Leucine-rich repeat (LRR) protein
MSIGKLDKLENLQLQFNQLKYLPPTLGMCRNLRFIYLNRNNLEEISDDFGQLTNLKELYLAGSGPMTLITEKLCDLRMLEILEIDTYTAMPPCLLVLQANRLQIIVK